MSGTENIECSSSVDTFSFHSDIHVIKLHMVEVRLRAIVVRLVH